MKKNTTLFFILLSVFTFSSFGFIKHEHPMLFIKGLLKDPVSVGAFFPCSEYAAKEICSGIDHSQGPLKILEVGSGTGALTQEIVKNLAEGDTLDLVELQSDFCEQLSATFCNDQVSLFCGSILDWQPDYNYDIIICSLPFNRFEPDFVTAILNHLKVLSKPNGKLSYIELMWVTSIKKTFSVGHNKQKLEQTLAIMRDFRTRYGIKTEPIYRNITPIYVHHTQLTA